MENAELKTTRLSSTQTARPVVSSNATKLNSGYVKRYHSVRQYSEQLCRPLSIEDYGLQAMASTSPAKWHLAHTTWFFETFILKPYSPCYQVFHPQFEYLFNSYYNGVGKQYPRHQRGLLSRPTVEDVYLYRAHVDEAISGLLDRQPLCPSDPLAELIELGCHHEQQHQELFFTDLKYCWFQNPMYPAYRDKPPTNDSKPQPIKWMSFDSSLCQIGHERESDFCFDNELPRHTQYVEGFRIADRLVSNGEFLEFMADKGYDRSELWLADGWAARATATQLADQVLAPLYWLQKDGQWWEYTLHGLIELDPNRPACHLSAYEADAFARWSNARLPTEFEWEVAANAHPNNPDSESISSASPLHPQYVAHPSLDGDVTGSLWQWTSSAYSPYPGFKTADGAVGEYNGKFMANQLVLRGGSVATSPGHYRHSYRNFFYPQDQWQFTGIRLAQNL
ncbi:MAG: ergothioneine biosynthesis protein EgtB [Pseudomonadales bacterium]